MNDPIVDDVRRIRDAHAAQFGYDLDAIYRDIKEQERKSGLQFVAGVAWQAKPSQASRPASPATPRPSDSGTLEVTPTGEC